MNQGITIATWDKGQDQCLTLLRSLKGCKFPVLVVINRGLEATWLDDYPDIQVLKLEEDCFELGAIQATLDHTDWDEFVLLQDTFEVKNTEIFNILFNNYPNQSVSYNPKFQMYLGKFRREILEQMELPVVRDKIESVRQEEAFIIAYRNIDSQVAVFNAGFDDTFFIQSGSWEQCWGRKNLVLQDEFLLKRKGLWDAAMLYEN